MARPKVATTATQDIPDKLFCGVLYRDVYRCTIEVSKLVQLFSIAPTSIVSTQRMHDVNQITFGDCIQPAGIVHTY